MELDDALVDKLAKLAQLSFTETEKKAVKEDLQRMILFVDKLNELDTTGIEPLLHMSEGQTAMRRDEVKGSVSRETALLNAPVRDEQFFKVPKVIQK